MVENERFCGQTIPSIIDTEYLNCNFAQPSPGEDAGQKVGVRLFPGDDTPRIFRSCNLVNAEPPPGSTLIMCNCVLVEHDLPESVENIEVDGLIVATKATLKRIVYGKYTTAGYEYLPIPKEYLYEEER